MGHSNYKHTQIGWAVLLIGGAAIAIVIARAAYPPPTATLIVLGGAAICVALFSTLTVEADDLAIEARFGPGWIRRRVNWSEIRSTHVVRNSWFQGFGIRWIGAGWMFNVSGRDAVELELQSGRRFRIGTDDPVALSRHISERLMSGDRG